MTKKKKKNKEMKFFKLVKSTSFQRLLVIVVTWLILSTVVAYEAAPVKYKLGKGDISPYDIQAPRDIENSIRTRQNAEEKASKLPPVVINIDNANNDMLNGAYEYFEGLNKLIVKIYEDNKYRTLDEKIQNFDEQGAYEVLYDLKEPALALLIADQGGENFQTLKSIVIKEIIPELTKKNLMEDNLAIEIARGLETIREGSAIEPLKPIAVDVLQKVIKPNSRLDEEATNAKREAYIESYIKENPVIIYKDERIISKDDVVTEDKYEVLKEINYIDSEGKPDYLLYMAVFIIILLLFISAFLYLRNFHPKVYYDRNSIFLICVSILITSFFAWAIREFIPDLSYFIIPVFIAPVLIAIFLGIEAAITINILLTFSFALMVGRNFEFMIMSILGGTFATFFTANATQRRKISMTGFMLGCLNALVIVLMGLIEKRSLDNFLNDGGLAFINGLLSIVLAIGLLPFLETTFNVVTPLKLLELADPNHPLLKRLLMEAPGTYHHSLMVGNLAEVATREIGGNALLARVGAYFHDVGKLKRPYFFKENQLSDNPHDKLTPNLSTLVITSHTKDGEEFAAKYRLPKIIRDIITQHHGNTLVAYFYHKATQTDKTDELNEDNFRYEGPVPDTREAAVVMLADSVEAAVRSLPEKTPGKTEGLVRKIIKDKLDDDQLSRCDLTLKDLSIIADSFTQVLSGVYHERPEYPELEKKKSLSELDNSIYNTPKSNKGHRRDVDNEASSVQPPEENGGIKRYPETN
ncbi:MAG: HD family phosphohydrolase [Acetivibrionales bacterium]|jgi:putative nucleotidyltransferase with HDIG domain|nr:HDIG domain-containing protein [Clostridiaceae bacterium]